MTFGEIGLYRGTDYWMADMAAAPNADETQRLFGTTQLPTPFPYNVPVERVMFEIRQRNPNVTVYEQQRERNAAGGHVVWTGQRESLGWTSVGTSVEKTCCPPNCDKWLPCDCACHEEAF